jgi:small subunit ribosomal protein S1
MSEDTTTTQSNSQLEKLLNEGDFLNVPKVGDLITGTILSTKGREVRMDVSGLTTGVIRGRELFTESSTYSDLSSGDKVEATVVELENENGEMELSFRYAGNKKSWEDLRAKTESGETIKVKILDANKGGLIAKAEHVGGFLPVSQLAPEHYPRVSGGDKQKILDKLRSFIGQSMTVKILDLNEDDEKLIFSEKAVWESEQKSVISQISVGDAIEGEVTALADFGAFVKFSPTSDENATPLEGLVHISEIAWQRIDHPKDLLKNGQTVKAQIIGIEGSKIFLSMKKLIEDPWTDVEKKYKVGDVVEGKILKINPFGFFVELDPDIHGLAHISEITTTPGEDVSQHGEAGKTREFKIVSIEPKEHRLGLSVKALNEKKEKAVEEAEIVEEKKEEPEEDVKVEAEVPVEQPAETPTQEEPTADADAKE